MSSYDSEIRIQRGLSKPVGYHNDKGDMVETALRKMQAGDSFDVTDEEGNLMSKQNTFKVGANLVPNRNYLVLEPENEKVRLKLEKTLKIAQQLGELSIEATQKLAVNPAAETCDIATIRCLNPFHNGKHYIGVIFTVSATDNDFDGYAAYFCPTLKDYHILEEDFDERVQESGFGAVK